MNKQEYLQTLDNIEIDINMVSTVEKIYEGQISDIAKRIISNSKSTIFIDETRLLSYNEILDAEEDLGVNFIQKQLLPLFDCGDNDFIVYHISNGKWSLFNIIDECVFKNASSFEELL